MDGLVSKLEKYLDTLSKRDQLSLGIIIVTVVMMIWFEAFYVPLSHKFDAAKADLGQSESKLVVARAKLNALQKTMSKDPDSENRKMLAKYRQENRMLDKRLAKSSTQIINSSDMVKLLEQILKKQPGLKFVSLENKPAVPVFLESKNSTNKEKKIKNVDSIYRHGVVLKVEGSYRSALAFMKKLEESPWKFFWQSVDIEAKKYPNSVITLEIYTLGFRDGFIGV